MVKPDYGGRLAGLRKAFTQEGLEGVLVSSLNDIYYYTGKALSRGDMGFLLVTRKARTLFVSGLDNELAGPGIRIMESLKSLRRELSGLGRLGYDERNLTVFTFRKLRTGPWKPFSEGIKSQRMLKDSYEIAQIREAARATLKVLGSLKVEGKTEFQVGTEILHKTRLLGKTPAFDPLVAAGRNSAFVHHIPGRIRISRGLVVVDSGACHNHYNADITRMFPIRTTAREDGMLECCMVLQAELIDMARPGTPFSSIQKRYQKGLKSMGYPVMHSFGHGLGLGVHEGPSGRDVLEKGMVITVEPGLYKKGLGGCRVEDMVLVDEKPVLLSG
jgi:Xaa-Pro aminopeptidase